MRVLVIEDNDDIRELLTTALEREGHAVAAAKNGAEGLLEAIDQRPDVILLDLYMPVMNGWEFRAKQTAISAIASIPVVVMSACGDHPGFDVAAFLTRPCKFADVARAVIQCGAQAPARAR